MDWEARRARSHTCDISVPPSGVPLFQYLVIFFFIRRLICLVLTLPVSIATTKCTFFAMKLVKTRLQNKNGRWIFIRLLDTLLTEKLQ